MALSETEMFGCKELDRELIFYSIFGMSETELNDLLVGLYTTGALSSSVTDAIPEVEPGETEGLPAVLPAEGAGDRSLHPHNPFMTHPCGSDRCRVCRDHAQQG